MAYVEQVTTTVGAVAAAILAFASDRGWTVSGSDITRPGGGLPITVASEANGSVQAVSASAGAGRTARTTLPWFGGTRDNGLVSMPTKTHLFGNQAPWDEEPWIGVVIECGYNSYRHLYIGNIEKIGNYTGGEIVSSNNYRKDYSGSGGGNNSFNSTVARYLFGGRHNHGDTADNAGGANIVHAENLLPWRIFRGPSASTEKESFSGAEIFGGHSDSINSGLLRRSPSDYAGSNTLVPVNLYAPDSVNNLSNVRFRPLGYCPGVRLVDMRDYDPGQSIQVGNQNWRVFPEFSKRLDTSVPYGTIKPDGGVNNYHPDYETSYMLGIAYPET